MKLFPFPKLESRAVAVTSPIIIVQVVRLKESKCGSDPPKNLLKGIRRFSVGRHSCDSMQTLPAAYETTDILISVAVTAIGYNTFLLCVH